MSQGQRETIRQPLLKTEYEPVTSTHKLNLLLQRSVRYSYRQRCCNCCPTILCELLFPIILIIILGLGRYGINRLDEEFKKSNNTIPGPFNQRPCSQDLNAPPTSSNILFTTCFKFPPRYKGGEWGSFTQDVSNRTNFVFEPIRNDINGLGQLARNRLIAMNCNDTEVL